MLHTFLVTNLLCASDPPWFLTTLGMKFFNVASKVLYHLAPSTPLASCPPSPFPSPPQALPSAGCQTVLNDLPCSFFLLGLCTCCSGCLGCPPSSPLPYCFSGLNLGVTAQKPSLTFFHTHLGPLNSSSPTTTAPFTALTDFTDFY